MTSAFFQYNKHFHTLPHLLHQISTTTILESTSTFIPSITKQPCQISHLSQSSSKLTKVPPTSLPPSCNSFADHTPLYQSSSQPSKTPPSSRRTLNTRPPSRSPPSPNASSNSALSGKMIKAKCRSTEDIVCNSIQPWVHTKEVFDSTPP